MGKLENYIVTYRKRAGLTQCELSCLLGSRGSAKVSRYEHFGRRPSLEGALACEAVFGVPVRRLFAGIYEEVETNVARRARELEKRITRRARPGQMNAQKLALLKGLTAKPGRRR